MCKVVFVTKLSVLPSSCPNCSLGFDICRLPVSRTFPDHYLRECLTERHPDCPLRIVSEASRTNARMSCQGERSEP